MLRLLLMLVMLKVTRPEIVFSKGHHSQECFIILLPWVKLLLQLTISIEFKRLLFSCMNGNVLKFSD